jgi:hypothetical protein
MPRQKIYPEEFLVRVTTQELHMIDGLAKKVKKSRSRFLVTAALTAGSNLAVDVRAFEAMLEVRAVTLMDLRKVRHRLENIIVTIRQECPVTSCNPNLDSVVDDLILTIHLLRKTWLCVPSPSRE